ncbi:hypothetical protein FOZ63_016890, partial [Perkinsus olseni]
LEDARKVGEEMKSTQQARHELLAKQASDVSDLLGSHEKEVGLSTILLRICFRLSALQKDGSRFGAFLMFPVRMAEAEALRQLREQERELLTKRDRQRDKILGEFRSKIESTSDELEKQRLIRLGMEAMAEIDINTTAERRELQERLKQRAKKRAVARKAKH